ncbi:melanopsin-like [Actinia tenebrosa]|uniref:Melanopsin-like n=1 Tax=Actinia tenebrosa TaxID=6105 RepID=A0A6P8I746_ACTTE|nr:melanopsin-like [Actinia tenebrosa]
MPVHMGANSSCFHFTDWLALGTVSRPLYATMMAINCITIIPAILLNALIVVTIFKTQSLRASPSMVIICNIALSDLVVGILAQPIFIAWITLEYFDKTGCNCALAVSFGLSSTLFAGVSLLNVTTSSVDRYLALYFHLRYLTIVTTRRACITCAVHWLGGAVISFSWIPFGFIIYSYIIATSMAVCILITIFCYTLVFKTLRRHQRQIDTQMMSNCNGDTTLPTNNVQNFKRFKKSVFIALSIFGAFLWCYLPCLCTLVSIAMKGYSLSLVIALKFSVTVVFINSALNPLLFLWKVSDLRLALLNIFSKLFH